eukprot:CAMPEP_0116556330 /NCGR_PEP_ID=MMETSP0397-20121206/8637_1 /TAXON_ID=216820 /ORGANISM="Cyclophora tenuis, Strain ECT3854" /LENGTH=193 /DNA_ID=CAMNT_0004081689 /DNA_START=70 /DNA_END=651 /DNA_ORIENTATION=+
MDRHNDGSSSNRNSNSNDSNKSLACPLIKSRLQQCEDELQKKQEEFGPDSIELVKPLSVLGLLHQHMTKDLSKALDCHEEILRILQQQLEQQQQQQQQVDDDDEHHDSPSRQQRRYDHVWVTETMAVTRTDLASCHEKRGDYERAKHEYAEAHASLVSIDCNQKLLLLESCSRGFDRTCRTPSERRKMLNPSA